MTLYFLFDMMRLAILHGITKTLPNILDFTPIEKRFYVRFL